MYTVSGRTSSIITAMLSILLALGMHAAAANRPHGLQPGTITAAHGDAGLSAHA